MQTAARMTNALIVIFESPLYLFYLGPVFYRLRIGARQLIAFPPPIECQFQTVVPFSLVYLRSTASLRCPSWSPWVAENQCWIVHSIAQKPPVRGSRCGSDGRL
jgi:hypothetical protein